MTVVKFLAAPDGEYEEVEVSDVRAFLLQKFGRRWPRGTRITSMLTGRQMVPTNDTEVSEACAMPGPLVIEVMPGGPETWTAIAVSLAISTASMILTAILEPKTPNATRRNVQHESPNNGLSQRTNEMRINGRIPDICGQTRSTPDLLGETYRIYDNHVEREIAYMCVGRGAYAIHDVRDDTTDVDQIPGMSVEVYGPNTSPNSGSPQLRIGDAITLPLVGAKRINAVNGQTLAPQDAGRVVRRGMVFSSPNVITSQDPEIDFNEYFVPGDTIVITGAAQADGTFIQTADANFEVEDAPIPEWGEVTLSGDHTAVWEIGDLMTISNGTVTWEAVTEGGEGYVYTAYGNVNGMYPVVDVDFTPGTPGVTTIRLDVTLNSSAWRPFRPGAARQGNVEGTPTLSRPSDTEQFDLSGTYTVNTMSGTTLTLSSPASVNPDWTVMEDDFGGSSMTLYPVIETVGERWVGWFEVQSAYEISRMIMNVVALNGMYKDNGRTQYARTVWFTIQIEKLDANGDPTGLVQTVNQAVVGSSVTRAMRANTINVELDDGPGKRWRVRARRTTDSDTDFDGSVVDEIKWQDLYICAPITNSHFGDVTTVYASSFATDGALAIKERKLNMLVTRKRPQRISGSTFTTELYETRNVADTIAAICLDPKIGNRSPAEIDFDNIYDTAWEIRDHFGVDVAQFDYTIDKDVLSFEETLSMIADAVFCRAYRRGSVIRLFFERENANSAILFNHRNKVPGSEVRADSFGGDAEGHDGVEYQWIDPETDTPTTIYIPSDQSAINPMRKESVGVRTYEQAHIHAWRLYNKLRYQNEVATFDALPEANLLTLSERISVADNTRANAQDGEITWVSSDNPRLVGLSQEVDWSAGPYVIFLQNSDRQVEVMGVSDGGGPRRALLEREPRTPIVLRGEGYNPTGFIIGSASGSRHARPFLITEKGATNDDGTIPLTAINYDARYYANDLDFIE
ncbi:host specificity factor TipJ family phage tail protein [Bordetella sp. 15P40C-2]|uniref:host specificity factor TipJ family phage tail protein n=1 Tax=Bordetella sp. 15P40C-2 TaxID=2572246 RepID=UPI0013229818|nr:host specificity factor TipJ family phage tail protein [Bordetella sp. 15P40C-2]MVW72126.1 hypothetical protein [Bordetella sp. 15P40C-2]